MIPADVRAALEPHPFLSRPSAQRAALHAPRHDRSGRRAHIRLRNRLGALRRAGRRLRRSGQAVGAPVGIGRAASSTGPNMICSRRSDP